MTNKKIFLSFIFVITLILFFPKGTNAANCPASAAGNYTLSSSCVIPAGGTMSIIDGNLTINGGVTLQIDDNARLTISPGYAIYPNGTILVSASGAKIEKKTYLVILNSASGNSCTTVCANNSKSCVSIGQNSYGTDTYYWGASVCTGSGSCSYNVGNCGTVMSDQCVSQNASCCGIDVYWTRCLCLTP